VPVRGGKGGFGSSNRSGTSLLCGAAAIERLGGGGRSSRLRSSSLSSLYRGGGGDAVPAGLSFVLSSEGFFDGIGGAGFLEDRSRRVEKLGGGAISRRGGLGRECVDAVDALEILRFSSELA
jgi:hypothetical protein